MIVKMTTSIVSIRAARTGFSFLQVDSFVIIEMLNRERVILIEQIQLIHFILTLCNVLISFMVDNIQCFVFSLSTLAVIECKP